MQIKLHAQHLSLSDTQKDFIEKKVGSLAHLADRLNDASSEIKVDISHLPSHSPEQAYHIALTFFVPHDTLRAEAGGASLENALDEAVEKVKGQIEHYKSKIHGGH